jgi:hypothetical protein
MPRLSGRFKRSYGLEKLFVRLSQVLGISGLAWVFYSIVLDALKRVHVLAALGLFIVSLLCILLNASALFTYLNKKSEEG